MKKTFDALFRRGFDSELAKKISETYTFSSLKTLPIKKLRKLGLDFEQIKTLDTSTRPPVPQATINSLIYDSKMICCICRKGNKAVIIHHIKPWEESKDHSEKNLVILCLEHHEQAHRISSLSQNLTSSNIRAAKKEWLKKVRVEDNNILLTKIDYQERWDYINITRLDELVSALKIVRSKCDCFSSLRDKGVIDAKGIIVEPDEEKNILLYGLKEHLQTKRYLDSLLKKVIEKINPFYIEESMSHSFIAEKIKEGQYFAISRSFYFKNVSKNERGVGQERKVYKNSHKLSIEFTIDAYYATSTSSWSSNLSRHSRCVPVCLVKNISQSKGRLSIKAACIAIGVESFQKRSELTESYMDTLLS